MVIHVVTLFPEMFSGVFGASMLKRARQSGRVDIRLVPLRPFGVGPHRQTDDYPFGGGVGMLLRADVVVPAVEWAMTHVKAPARVLVTSPQGRRFDQRMAEELAHEQHLVVIAGHYEGLDERARLLLGAEEVSIGDFVLTGGELPAMVMVDAVARLLPGVLGAADGARSDSFSRDQGWLEGPQYTRPEQYRGLAVPEVLLSGNHQAIREYQEEMARRWTQERRPDLLANERRDTDGLH
ncbi:tRNA (guanosine(37)-N1)-methyltransferase TrmD [Sulfobacillus sp. DSM 109850]|uniref:tRNA (guanine-N(1)-)-methyltransferase n=1 Tax=Sulfobacillus harzensis TaxID=2729629 RepID=A0A7Y0L793_9FIRM|nr:tRNA (guanosine(37)-N1)-methyltransferase TrmD [Sulfobacillus harzensis]NMP24608.1 tRNA (guanosine(37)-N1)-methyltransferase TrmD [Sulfobacillus harzensis]